MFSSWPFFSTFITARKIIIIIVVEWLWSCPCLVRNIQFLSLSPHGSFFKVNVKLSLLHALFGMHIAMHIHGKLIDWCRLIVINVNLSFLVNQFPRVCLSGLLPCYKHMPFVCVCLLSDVAIVNNNFHFLAQWLLCEKYLQWHNLSKFPTLCEHFINNDTLEEAELTENKTLGEKERRREE